MGPCKAWARALAQLAGLPLPHAIAFAIRKGMCKPQGNGQRCYSSAVGSPLNRSPCSILLFPCPGAALVAVYGFAVAAMWIALFATEIVGLLQFFGMLRCAAHACTLRLCRCIGRPVWLRAARRLAGLAVLTLVVCGCAGIT